MKARTPQNSTRKAKPYERRSSQRFALRGDAKFQWRSGKGEWQEGSGTSRNLGRDGVFVESTVSPAVDSEVRMVVTFDGDKSKEMGVRLCGTGSVRHVYRGPEGESGYGARVNFRTEVTKAGGQQSREESVGGPR